MLDVKFFNMSKDENTKSNKNNYNVKFEQNFIISLFTFLFLKEICFPALFTIKIKKTTIN